MNNAGVTLDRWSNARLPLREDDKRDLVRACVERAVGGGKGARVPTRKLFLGGTGEGRPPSSNTETS